MAQSVKGLTLAQVMISLFMSSSPKSCFVLTAQSLEPALDSVSPSLSASPSLSLKNNIKKNLTSRSQRRRRGPIVTPVCTDSS